MDLLDTIRTDEQASQSETDGATAALWKQYRDLLRRADSPQKGDEARLAELMRELGLDARHVELHRVVLRQAEEYRRQIDAGAEAVRAAQPARDKVAALERQIAEIRKAIGEKAKTVGFAQGAGTLAADATDRLGALTHEFSLLLCGRPASEPLAGNLRRFVAGPSQAVADQKRKLGL